VIGNAFVVDAVVHGYNFAPENRIGGKYSDGTATALGGAHTAWSPSPEWALPPGRIVEEPISAELLGSALFRESQTDACIYHETPHWGLFKDGGSPLTVGKRMRELWPTRVAIYGGVSPWQPDAIEVVDRLVDEDGAVALKLYPLDLVDGKLTSLRMDDEKLLYPLLEHAKSKGIRTIGIHKAVPYGPVPLEPFRMDDLDGALVDFPDLTFEVVHGGLAFVEETCSQLSRFPNVVVNLEGTTGLINVAPRRFLEVLGQMLMYGGGDRIVWATGCALLHPRPLIEAFWKLEMPADLIAGYGLPQLTPEIKRAILGENFLRLSGIDFRGRQAAEPDELGDGALATPWSGDRVA
jgi:predicted TIM-barrel fold metal-dependent hydrolase